MKGAVGDNRIGVRRSVRAGLSAGLGGILLMAHMLSASYYYSQAYEHQMTCHRAAYPPRGHGDHAREEQTCPKCILLELAGRACRELSYLDAIVSFLLAIYLTIFLIKIHLFYFPPSITLVSLKIRLDN